MWIKYALPHFLPPFLDSPLNSMNLHTRYGCAPSPSNGLFMLGAKCNEVKNCVKHLCPGWGSNPGCRVRIRGCTSIDKLHSTTYTSSIIRFFLGSQYELQQTYISDTDVLQAHWMGNLCWAPNHVTR